jgi:hypothetical protein
MAEESRAEKSTERLTVRIGKLEQMIADFLAAQGYKPQDPGHAHKPHEAAQPAHAHTGLSPELAHMNQLGDKLIRVLEEIRDRL